MALIGNYHVFNKSCGRFLCATTGANGAFPQTRAAWNKPGWFKAFGQQDGSGGTTTTYPTTSLPEGYYPPIAWAMPITAGGMSARPTDAAGGVSSANLAGGYGAEGDLSGSGGLTNADLVLVANAVATILGAGSLTAALVGSLNASADLLASGDVAGSITALAHIAAEIDGLGDLDAVVAAYGSMSADINVLGGSLTTANVADLVWGAISTGAMTYAEIMRILVAIAAGKTTIVDLGGGAATVTFRDTADTKDVVVADMINSARDVVTLDTSE